VQSFHFRIAAQPEDPAQWKRLAAEWNLPLRAEVLGSIPAIAKRGFFEVNDPSVQLLAFKPAEASPAYYVLRFQDNGGKGARGVRLISPFRFIDPVRATTTETATTAKINLADFSLQPWETLTVLTKIQP
jgi:alpha-mannosidase